MSQSTFDVGYAIEILPALFRATLVTMQAALGAAVLALILGLVLAILRVMLPRTLSSALMLGIEVVRSTPLLVQVFIVFYVLPHAGITLSPLTAGIVTIGIHYSAYLAEVFRAGVLSVPRGQWETITALNMSQPQGWRFVILPQAVPPVLPVIGNYLIAMLKDTPVLALITVQELLGTALSEASQSFRYVEPILMVGLIFLALSYPLSLVVRFVERRLLVVR